MKLKTISSSSFGNCHILETDTCQLILDCGVKTDKILKHIDMKKLDGILVTHSHGDHTKGIKDFSKYLKTDIKIHSHKACLDVLDIVHTKKSEIKELEMFSVGPFQIIGYYVGHDVPNMNYIIKDTVSNYMIVYCTDSGYVENINLPSGVDAFIIEANHDEEVLRELIELNDENKIRYERVISRLGHLSVQKTETFLERTADINTKKIVLCHLSRSNYEPNKFKNIVAAKFPSVDVYELDPTEVSNVREIVLRKKKINFSEL